MLEAVKLFATISRAEFLLPNLGSLIMGLAWGATTPINLTELIISAVFSFTVINLSSAIGAQINTFYDYELDLNDYRKKHVVQALDSFGKDRLKMLMALEFVFTLILVFLFAVLQGKYLLLLMWVVGISLGYTYSAPPIKLKSRSWLAPISLILVLAVFPVLFAYYMFMPKFNPLFLTSLLGLALTVYSVIIPTEIRDYFGDKAMNIKTVTVHIGLVNASLLSLVLLAIGGTLFWLAFFFEFAYSPYSFLSIVTFAIPVIIFIVLRKFKKLFLLSKDYMHSNGNSSLEEKIVDFSTQNLQWIMLVTQTYSIISIILLIEKILLS